MITYACYQIWDYLDQEITEMPFENDKEALDFWLKLADDIQCANCYSLTRLSTVNGISHEEFIAMFRQGKDGLEIMKSQAL